MRINLARNTYSGRQSTGLGDAALGRSAVARIFLSAGRQAVRTALHVKDKSRRPDFHLGQAEIQDLHLPPGRYEDVGRFNQSLQSVLPEALLPANDGGRFGLELALDRVVADRVTLDALLDENAIKWRHS